MYLLGRKMEHWSKSVLLPVGLLFVILCGCGAQPAQGDPPDSSQTVSGTEAGNGRNLLAAEEPIGDLSDREPPAAGSPADDGGAAEIFIPRPEVSIVMVGDILLHMSVEKSAIQEDGSYNFDALFAQTAADIARADVAVVNQEVILGGAALGVSGYPRFNSPYEVGDALVKAGFDVVCHGTNHALDMGRQGLMNCLDFWENNYPDIAVLGINRSQKMQDDIYIYEKDGIRIAFLNYTYGTNGLPMPGGMPYAVDVLSEEKVAADIARAEAEADFTIVCPHWGTEYYLQADSYQKKWADIFLKNGVDLVIGTHPHVIGPIEWLEDEETGNGMLVYYSLGNFVNWAHSKGAGIANRMVGGMAQVLISMDGAGRAFIADYGVKALVCHLESGSNGVTTYELQNYTKELAEKNAVRLQDANFSKEYCENLCDDVWGELWRKQEGAATGNRKQ